MRHHIRREAAQHVPSAGWLLTTAIAAAALATVAIGQGVAPAPVPVVQALVAQPVSLAPPAVTNLQTTVQPEPVVEATEHIQAF